MRITEYRKTLFQAQLKPVPAGYSITGPIVKILMGNYTFNSLESRVCARLWVHENCGGIKNIESLVLHGTHIKVIHRNNHKNIKIIFSPIDFLIPTHRFFQGQHCMITFIEVFFFDKDFELDLTARTGFKSILNNTQSSSHQSKQVRWLLERIMPGHKMSIFIHSSPIYRVTI